MHSATSTQPWQRRSVRLLFCVLAVCGLSHLSVLANNDLSAHAPSAVVPGQVMVTSCSTTR
jgi:hypothetical protein